MVPWIIGALRLLGGAAAFGVGAEAMNYVGGAFNDGRAWDEMPRANVISSKVGGIPPHPHRRRRRRRALTASDKSDIAFIAGILGKAAGGRFAVALGARSR